MNFFKCMGAKTLLYLLLFLAIVELKKLNLEEKKETNLTCFCGCVFTRSFIVKRSV